MINKDDTILIQTLTSSFNRQLQWYEELKVLGRQMMSALVLSRGSMAKVSDNMNRKMKLLESIETERKNISTQMVQWQERKERLPQTQEILTFDTLLEKVTEAIRDFLNDEEQLQKYLEGIVSQNNRN